MLKFLAVDTAHSITLDNLIWFLYYYRIEDTAHDQTLNLNDGYTQDTVVIKL